MTGVEKRMLCIGFAYLLITASIFSPLFPALNKGMIFQYLAQAAVFTLWVGIGYFMLWRPHLRRWYVTWTIDQHMVRCHKCRYSLTKGMRFCVCCGVQNIGFSQKELDKHLRDTKQTWPEIQAKCQSGHSDLTSLSAINMSKFFCMHCGEQLLPAPTIAG